MKYIWLICLIGALNTGCMHKTVVEMPPPPPAVEEPDYTESMTAVYEKLIRSIKKRDFEGILSCYREDATFNYSPNQKNGLHCYDGSLSVSGKQAIQAHYQYLFKTKLLDSIEFEIMKIDNKNKRLKFVNLWANVDYDVYEYLDFTIENGKALISRHTVAGEM